MKLRKTPALTHLSYGETHSLLEGYHSVIFVIDSLESP
jgi:hypothetical protein